MELNENVTSANALFEIHDMLRASTRACHVVHKSILGEYLIVVQDRRTGEISCCKDIYRNIIVNVHYFTMAKIIRDIFEYDKHHLSYVEDADQIISDDKRVVVRRYGERTEICEGFIGWIMGRHRAHKYENSSECDTPRLFRVINIHKLMDELMMGVNLFDHLFPGTNPKDCSYLLLISDVVEARNEEMRSLRKKEEEIYAYGYRKPLISNCMWVLINLFSLGMLITGIALMAKATHENSPNQREQFPRIHDA